MLWFATAAAIWSPDGMLMALNMMRWDRLASGRLIKAPVGSGVLRLPAERVFLDVASFAVFSAGGGGDVLRLPPTPS